MELKTFVSQTLIEILEGVSLAQDKAGELGAKVIPTLAPGGGSIRDIEFDVEVKTAEGTETKGGIGIYVGAIGLGSQGQSNAQTSSVGRIRFAIPVVMRPQPKA